MITKEESALAHEIAAALNDKLSIGFYRKCAKTIPPDELRDMLRRVLSIPDEDVDTTRGRIFTTIAKAYLDDMYESARD